MNLTSEEDDSQDIVGTEELENALLRDPAGSQFYVFKGPSKKKSWLGDTNVIQVDDIASIDVVTDDCLLQELDELTDIPPNPTSLPIPIFDTTKNSNADENSKIDEFVIDPDREVITCEFLDNIFDENPPDCGSQNDDSAEQLVCSEGNLSNILPAIPAELTGENVISDENTPGDVGPSTSSDCGNISSQPKRLKRTRQPVPDPNVWAKEETKFKRLKGEAYTGYRRLDKTSQKVMIHDSPKNGREMGPTCPPSSRCSKIDVRKCHVLSHEVRLNLFTSFWRKKDNWAEKKCTSVL